MRKGDALDPKGLIEDSYRIDGITIEECRSIFVDWALARPIGGTEADTISLLLDRHGAQAEDHPMTKVLREGLAGPATTGRRGGRRGRLMQN